MKKDRVEFVVVDEHAEARIDDIAHLLQEYPSLSHAKIIHLCAPSADFLNRRPGAKAGVAIEAVAPEMHTYIHGGLIARMAKPARTQKFLRILSRMWDARSGYTNGSTLRDGLRGNKISADMTSRSVAYAGNVLVAEDNPIARNLLVRQLQRHGSTVTAANNGEEAIQL
ncbi:hypothetical protein DACRYDRAFT_108298 [Dacryopinax primogenitus]|uniref:Response regulatory domain-containing protein n=1 Tax=Dacryopinax primogenitus (strain DJM 731) TaxID=1858805 RepID=M5FYK8_DACPD|nr:uncharacterized protein DACRYDRAFT_108298 [Dacryopinax primogenitus]EJU00960.1 hypothetical protein DACRYDRAFT_108298 [Dacryopinax primogenitus]